MLRSFFISVSALAALAATATAQSTPTPATWPTEKIAVDVDSGYLHNNAGVERVVFRHTFRYELTMWQVLSFGEGTNLPTGSTLRVRSLADGAVQNFDAASIAAYHLQSAGMNGAAVEIELVAGANTRGNRISVTEVLRAIDTQMPESLCGADDRALSSDVRQGRLVRNGTPGCTAWLIHSDLVLTAGHCTTSTMQIEFNVPLSTSSGSLVRSAPNDVYPITLLQSTGNGGIGNDWALLRVGTNSNTGLTPAQANGGQIYQLGAVPTSTAGQNIRITGYGSTSSPVSPTFNQAQKTHFDALTEIQSTYLRYIPDTTGGNSGSPVIHENTGNAVGIHTHAGCTSGGNHGTRIDRRDLQAAINNNSGTPGSFTTFGLGCAGSGSLPSFCAGANTAGGTLSNQTAPNEYAYEVTSAAPLTINGVELYTASQTGGSTTLNVAIYGAGPSTAPLWTGTMTVGAAPGFYQATVSPALSLPAGTFYVAGDHTAGTAYLADLSGGSAGRGYWRRPAGSGAWAVSGIVSAPSVRVLCQGGGGGGAVPTLASSSDPRIGQAVALSLSQAAANTNAFLVIGISNTAWSGGALPQPLDGFGAPGCNLLVSTEFVLGLPTDGLGEIDFNLNLPNDPGLIGTRSYQQFLVLDPTINNLGLVTSNGGDLLIGG